MPCPDSAPATTTASTTDLERREEEEEGEGADEGMEEEATPARLDGVGLASSIAISVPPSTITSNGDSEKEEAPLVGMIMGKDGCGGDDDATSSGVSHDDPPHVNTFGTDMEKKEGEGEVMLALSHTNIPMGKFGAEEVVGEVML